MTARIYLDYAAHTPLCEPARAAMEGCPDLGNPSSLHTEGRMGRMVLDTARESFSNALGCQFGEVLFTSSGTESANLAILGTALAHKGARRRILVPASEHHCVLHTEEIAAKLGFTVEQVAVDRLARVDLEALARAMDDRVLLVACMHANNELGTLNPVREAAQIAHGFGALCFCDAVQTFPTLLDPGTWVEGLGCDLVSWSSHKFYGPSGSGGLYVRAGTPMAATIVGGGQERELRAGTEAVRTVAGSAAALGYVLSSPGESGQIESMRDAFLQGLRDNPDVVITADPLEEPVLPGHAHLRFPGINSETLLVRLDRAGLSASSGAACSSGSIEPSHVLLAAGFGEAGAKEGVRFTFGRGNTMEQAAAGASLVAESVDSILRRR